MDEAQVIKFYDKLSEMSERIARMETMLQAREAENTRITSILDEHEERIVSL